MFQPPSPLEREWDPRKMKLDFRECLTWDAC
jgi:hypothetical protein